MKRLILVLSLFAILLPILFISNLSARTWYIKPDGMGGAPTIPAGVDSAVAGDTVLVAAGVYEMETWVNLKEGIALISEKGPVHTKLKPKHVLNVQSAIVAMNIDLYSPETKVIGFWFEGFYFAGITLAACKYTYIMHNIFTGNDYGIYVNLGGGAHIENNTFYANNRFGIDASDGGEGMMYFNIIWDRANGLDFVFTVANDFLVLGDSYPYQVNNFSLDPEFCGAAAGNFYLQSDSPCAPGNSPFPSIGLIGALPVNCGTSSVEAKTWGEIKCIYRE